MDLTACSFCRKTPAEVQKLVEADTGARICDECVSLSVAIMAGLEPGSRIVVEANPPDGRVSVSIVIGSKGVRVGRVELPARGRVR